jgi:hypothetical protein
MFLSTKYILLTLLTLWTYRMMSSEFRTKHFGVTVGTFHTLSYGDWILCHIHFFYYRSVINLCVRLCLVNKSLSRREPEIYLFSRTSRWDRLCCTPSILFHGLQGLLHRRWSGRGVRLTAYVSLVSRFAMSGTIWPLPSHALVYILTALAVTSTFTWVTDHSEFQCESTDLFMSVTYYNVLCPNKRVTEFTCVDYVHFFLTCRRPDVNQSIVPWFCVKDSKLQ